ncbi:MAG TPA: ammonium transporter, partial [Rhizomicrobium sp.]
WVKRWIGYDDALDAWGVHGVGGALGAILTGVFASNAVNPSAKGWLADGNLHQMLLQFYDVVATFAYCAIVTFLILRVLDLTLGLRVPVEDEIEGLDFTLHGETVHA